MRGIRRALAKKKAPEHMKRREKAKQRRNSGKEEIATWGGGAVLFCAQVNLHSLVFSSLVFFSC
jgi:hypothetical protein